MSLPLDKQKVFLSYPRGGAAHTWAEQAQEHFIKSGAEVFRDESTIREGDAHWSRAIESALVAADVLVAIIGADSAACRWQERELLRADELGLPVVVLRIADVRLPLCIAEKQPVEARGDPPATLAKLTDAVARAGLGAVRLAAAGTSAGGGIPEAQRRDEVLWLESLVFRDLSDREERYVALQGRERKSLSAEGALKSVRMDAELLFRAFGMDAAQPDPAHDKSYLDVLDAFRALARRRVRRLAVLGEPGAGKSFSLERIAVDYARAALKDAAAPIPLLLRLGLWTRADEGLEAFIARTLPGPGRHLRELIRQGRALLLLDAVNEIPPGQRRNKAAEIKAVAADERLAGVVLSCREKDFGDLSLPCDTLSLQPLGPPKVREFLRRYYALKEADRGAQAAAELAEARFWRIAGGDAVREAWEAWRAAGAADLFWTAEQIPRENPNVYSNTSGEQDAAWRKARFDARNLLRLAANPYLLHIMASLPQLPAKRAQLFRGFLQVLYERERDARAARHDGRVPPFETWLAALETLAEALQRRAGGEAGADGAGTALPRSACPAALDEAMLDFSRDASVLELVNDALRFSHQLLQEYLASRLLLDASRTGRSAAEFWPPEKWWQRSGWEVVAEIAAESCTADAETLAGLIMWLAEANPDLAAELWQRSPRPSVPAERLWRLGERLLPRMIDPALEPEPRARAALGRALGRFGLDNRPGIGLTPQGLPDIAWVHIPGPEPFIYQGERHPGLPAFQIARYPVTHAQFQAFIAAGGYGEARWWQGLAGHPQEPDVSEWDEPNSPRVDVSWYEAVAFCRWLSAALGFAVFLPAERQWERAASSTGGREYPWGGHAPGHMNCREQGEYVIGRTSAPGIFPQGASAEGVLDLSGNVWEWCMDPYDGSGMDPGGEEGRVLRGGGWGSGPGGCRAARRFRDRPVSRGGGIGFRVCRGSPIETQGAGTPDTAPPVR